MTGSHWFEPIADHLGSAYLRYSFTKGTRQECDALVEMLHLKPGMRVLDVGCGPGRHARALAERGLIVHGIDISETFIDLARHDAPAGATFERFDARDLVDSAKFRSSFDAVICLCQGAFGLMTVSDSGNSIDANTVIFRGMARALTDRGRLALSAFSSYFVVRAHARDEFDAKFDAASGVNHERTEVKSPTGEGIEVDLWTACYTPRELRLLCELEGLAVESLSSVEPGAYGREEPHVRSPEFLLVARRM